MWQTFSLTVYHILIPTFIILMSIITSHLNSKPTLMKNVLTLMTLDSAYLYTIMTTTIAIICCLADSDIVLNYNVAYVIVVFFTLSVFTFLQYLSYCAIVRYIYVYRKVMDAFCTFNDSTIRNIFRLLAILISSTLVFARETWNDIPSGLVFDLTKEDPNQGSISPMHTILVLSTIAVLLNIILRILIFFENRLLNKTSEIHISIENISTFGTLFLISLTIITIVAPIIWATYSASWSWPIEVWNLFCCFIVMIVLPGFKILHSKDLRKWTKNRILDWLIFTEVKTCTATVSPEAIA